MSSKWEPTPWSLHSSRRPREIAPAPPRKTSKESSASAGGKLKSKISSSKKHSPPGPPPGPPPPPQQNFNPYSPADNLQEASSQNISKKPSSNLNEKPVTANSMSKKTKKKSPPSQEHTQAIPLSKKSNSTDHFENYDGIPREYDLLNVPTDQNIAAKKKKKSKATVPNHLKAISLLNSEEIGKIPLKDQLKGLHIELLDEESENQIIDSNDFPLSQQSNDSELVVGEPFYFQSSVNQDLQQNLPVDQLQLSKPTTKFLSKPSKNVNSTLLPGNDMTYANNLIPSPPNHRGLFASNVSAKSSPIIKATGGNSLSPAQDISYAKGTVAGAVGGETFVPQMQQQVESLVDDATHLQIEENRALETKFAELIIDKSRIKKLALIGEGYFGEVWRGVWDGSLSVALKCLKHGVKSSADKHKFFSEVSNLAKMRHPNITVFYGATPAPDAFIISELLQCSLFQLIYAHKNKLMSAPQSGPKPLPLKAILRILSDVSYGGNNK